MMSSVPAQPDRDIVMNDLIDALRVFAVESDVFVDVFARAHGLGRSDLNAIMSAYPRRRHSSSTPRWTSSTYSGNGSIGAPNGGTLPGTSPVSS